MSSSKQSKTLLRSKTMPPAPALQQTSSRNWESSSESRFSSLRGVRWRVHLGILPKSPASIDDLRRVAADSRRRYAILRRRIIVDPHLSKDENKSTDLVVDNPLSQSPDSLWSRYFRNAELEKMLDQDLSRLYPEQGSYFQTATCQTMLRQILLLWCLIHPEYGYRQGMHELLAPLLYVLHVDLQYITHVREHYEDHFNDEFHGLSLPEIDLISTYRFEKIMNQSTGDKDSSSKEKDPKVRSLDELDPEIRDIFLMSDAYGVEGELGIVLSEKFMEHDAYCLFDYLMNNACGVVAMAEFFSPSPATGSSTGLPPILEASYAMYHLLSIIDSSLFSHLVEIGVEPQYFALRWLRLLFGREFSLENLLVVWDEIFSSPNHVCFPDDANAAELRCRILCSPRGAFVLAMAVSMLLYLRPSLLATEYATACLQRLLNFPEDISAKKLIEKAKSLKSLALDTVFSLSSQGGTLRYDWGRRGHSRSYGSSPIAPNLITDSYWEEQWRLLHAAAELNKGNCGKTASSKMAKEPVIERFGLSRTTSDPCSTNMQGENKNVRPSDRYGLQNRNASEDSLCLETEAGINYTELFTDQNVTRNRSDVAGETCFSAENSLSMVTSPFRMINDHEYDSEESCATSSSMITDIFDETNLMRTPSNISIDKEENSITNIGSGQGPHRSEKQKAVFKRFQWLRKFNRGSGEGTMENRRAVEPQKSYVVVGDPCKNICHAPASDLHCSSFGVLGKIEDEDKDVTETLRFMANSILENIQVIESILKKDQGLDGFVDSRSTTISEEEQVAAMVALEELRKISNFLSEI